MVRHSGSSKKRHKSHKKHKHKRQEYESETIDVVTEDPAVEEQFIETVNAENLKAQSSILRMSTQTPLKVSKKKRTRGRDSGTSSEEERWLDAIESGKLEEVDDELKKIKDPKLMTARQRAMYERGTDKEPAPRTEVLMSLPTGYKEKVMTAEAIQKAQIKSQKRKQLADEKREKDKQKTMERLLKKQDCKIKSVKSRQVKAQVPMISYRNSLYDATLTFPPNFEVTIKRHDRIDPPKPLLCAIPSCGNIKRYNCSKTKIPLCSFKCYKKNVDSIKNIIF